MRVRTTFDQELSEIKGKIAVMGDFVRGMTSDALKALRDGDTTLSEEVVRRDDVADTMDMDIEAACLRCMALQQPVAGDLRLLATALKVIADLERIGDYSVDVAKSLRRIDAPIPDDLLARVLRMGEAVTEMTSGAVNALLASDVAAARRVGESDDEVDRIWKSIRNDLCGQMGVDLGSQRWVVELLLLARYLERIGDHATNVAERVGYVETGQLKQLSHKHQA